MRCILTEYLPHPKLVVANGWIEGLTVGSIILGTVLGGALVSETLSSKLLAFDLPLIDTGIDSAPEIATTLTRSPSATRWRRRPFCRASPP